MHITSFAKLTALGLILASTSLQAKEVYSWKNANGTNTYSDVPRNLKSNGVNTINVRTQTVSTPPAAKSASEGASLSEQQKQINDKMAANNKQVEEKNKQIEEENRKTQEANCKTARMNRAFAESARTANRDTLMARYDADIEKFCSTPAPASTPAAQSPS
ncbi:DUF4124 domain-containing protein [Neisseria wadsworthii]|uniref:DUF4124 domain-containing protein n=1 Tax=Neisseria wadsworthii 9715 TaxID=1030841 RepID=G4CSB4_9NEIS|nr:DUF4124 domain-containing protein [Neisseria wadsworthii]EGZ44730.1 hypothetical protein HMPREF9370_1974 [Neisseria wadsworthii 9715]QMT35614.1 DUF4124 domain-containing protein [Neisseria wadsworthii]